MATTPELPSTESCEDPSYANEVENAMSEEEIAKKYEKMSNTLAGRMSWLAYVFNWDFSKHNYNPVWLSIDEYKRNATASIANCWQVLKLPGWKLEKRGLMRGDVVESINIKEYGKVFRFTGTVDCPAKFLYEELRDNFTKMPEWNPTILRTDMIKKIGPGIDLSYQVTAGGGKGIIAPRDFVTLRRAARLRESGEVIEEDEETDREPHAYISSGISTEVPGYPPDKTFVRGNTKIGCWFLKPVIHKSSSGRLEDRCIFQWLFSCDLKGRIPSFVLDTAFATVMLDNVKYIRQHTANAKAKGLF